MGLFDFFRRAKPEPDPKLQHPQFGEIQYVDDALWERGRFYFQPVGSEVELLITASREGPDARHLQFLDELAGRWPDITKAAGPIARRTLEKWIEDPDKGEIWPRLKLEALNVLPGVAADEQWEITFWCEEPAHWLVFEMHGWRPKSAHVDG